MDMSQYAGKAFIKLDDVKAGPIQDTIVSVKVGNYDKPVVTLASGRQLSLNKTNVGILIRTYGKDSHDSEGCRVELYAGEAPGPNGDMKPSVVLRPISSAKTHVPEPKTKSAPGDEMGDEISF